MDTTQMEYVIKVADEKTFSRAADRLHITQPALSRSISRIESSLGINIFHRDGKQIILTEQGRKVYDFCKMTLSNYKVLLHDLHQNEVIRQTIHIACSGYVFSRDIIIGFRKKHPEILIDDREFSKDEFETTIRNADGVLSVKNYSAPGIQSYHVYRAPLYVALPVNHVLTSKKSLTIQAISKERFIITNDNNLFYEMVDDAFRKAGYFLLTDMKVEKNHMIHMLAEGMGASILSIEAVRLLNDSENVKCIPLEDDFCHADVFFIWREKPSYSPAFKSFLFFIQQYTFA